MSIYSIDLAKKPQYFFILFVLVFLSFFSIVKASSITFVQEKNNDAGGGSNQLSIPINTTVNNTLVVYVDSNGTTVSGITDTAGDMFTEKTGSTYSIWTATNIGISSSVTITLASSSFPKNAVILEYSGVASIGTSITNSGNGTNASVSINTQDNNNYVVAGFSNNSLSSSPSANQGTIRLNQYNHSQGSVGISAIDNTAASPTLVTDSVVFSTSQSWNAAAVELRASSSGGSDTTPPSIPTGLSATTISSSVISLSWTASTDNIGVTGYKIYRGGVQIGTSATNSYSDTGLSASTQYTYTVSAYDAAGNTSSQSISASATTQAVVVGASGNIYIAQTAAGSANGFSCANAYPVSFFNTAANWGTSSGQIGPGVTVHLCGTLTGGLGGTILTAQGSGTNGNPITIKWETGALLSSPACATKDNGGCINTNGNMYLTFDGNNTTPSLTNTANGTAGNYPNQIASQGIMAIGCNHCIFENLQITNLYVITSYTDDAPSLFSADPSGIWISGSNYTITNSIFDQMNHGITSPFGNGDTGNTFSNNTFDHINQGISLGNNNTNMMSNIVISGNHIKNMVTWDNHNDDYHHDGIFFFQDSAQANSISNVYVYDNLFDGDMGNNATAWIYYNSGLNGIYVFNNVILNPTNRGSFLLEGGYAGDKNLYVYNNFLDCGAGSGSALSYSSVNNFVIENNAVQNCSTVYNLNTISGLTKDYNAFKNFSSGEAHSLNVANLQVSSTGVPQSGSPLIQAGTNLTSLNIPALDLDAAGVSRPSTGPWDIGAYQYSSGSGTDTTPPSVPQSLVASPVSASSVSLTWSPSTDNVGVTGYNIYRGGVKIGTSATNSYTDTGLSASTLYTYTVSAYDAAGNTSALSSSASATTQSATPVPGDLNLDHIVNSLDFSLLNSKWNTNYPSYDLYPDGIINALDYAIMSANWGKTW